MRDTHIAPTGNTGPPQAMNAKDCFIRGLGMSLSVLPMTSEARDPSTDAVAISQDFRAVGQDMMAVISREMSLLPQGGTEEPATEQLELFSPRA